MTYLTTRTKQVVNSEAAFCGEQNNEQQYFFSNRGQEKIVYISQNLYKSPGPARKFL